LTGNSMKHKPRQKAAAFFIFNELQQQGLGAGD